ncbi:bifunctional nuclease family protein [Cyanobium sp. T1B-Tous]|uniref:bifunctional nuclease family protein n=1 Tax=Cyanobium sp. T1B-Tous TaxID=2823721 RepID=UPI0020CC1098|nr:bifunctional nuclease family protein [Cyanobium sp. T1B-Tous]MCP9804953.1 bifunctional nuclease family protein [Cyanobium sp. T1B-Tous]MCX5940906.1 bifunctional nuclease family protein [Cyanobium sp. LacPavin_0818_WC50_MAG_67_9]
MVEMRVAGIGLDAASRSPIVLLRDPSGRRQVPIWIDQAQAQNILAGLSNEPPPRPLSHDLMAALIDAGGLRLDRVVIHTIEDSTFRAVLKLLPAQAAGAGESGPGESGSGDAKPATSLELDARPSDAIALALRTHSPIWMLEEVVADASIPVDAEADAEDQDKFRRFLDSTSPADLVRHLRQAHPEPGSASQTEAEPEPPAPGPGEEHDDSPGAG